MKGNPSLHNTRTGLGGFADSVGAMSYALTPFTVALGTRESILSALTGISPSSFNFLHRWLGRIMLCQALLHTLGWTLIEGRFYQPQPATWTSFTKQPYIIWGWDAMVLLIFLFILSFRRVVQLTGYEFFRKTHYILACKFSRSCLLSSSVAGETSEEGSPNVGRKEQVLPICLLEKRLYKTVCA